MIGEFSGKDLRVIRDSCQDIYYRVCPEGAHLGHTYPTERGRDTDLLARAGSSLVLLSESPNPIVAKAANLMASTAHHLITNVYELQETTFTLTELRKMSGFAPFGSTRISSHNFTPQSIPEYIQMERSSKPLDQLKISISKDYTGLTLLTGAEETAHALICYAETKLPKE